jgi:hypothetical protein
MQAAEQPEVVLEEEVLLVVLEVVEEVEVEVVEVEVVDVVLVVELEVVVADTQQSISYSSNKASKEEQIDSTLQPHTGMLPLPK